MLTLYYCPGLCMRAELPLKDLKNYTAWKDRMLQRPAVKKIHAAEQNPLATAA